MKSEHDQIVDELTAAHERESALRVDNEMLAGGAEALRQDLEQERSRNNWLNCDRDGLEKSLAEAQRKWGTLRNWMIRRGHHGEALDLMSRLDAAQPSTGEPGT